MTRKACKAGAKKRKKISKDPRYVCGKCGARVHKKKNACKPEKM